MNLLQAHPHATRCGLATALLLTTLAVGCALPLTNNSSRDDRLGEALSFEQRYAGEVLAYLMRVVLGRAGNIAHHEAWRRQGLGQPLDLDWIAATMNDPDRSKRDLMVMDAGLIGLSEVLYDYNPQLNLFEGRYAFHSPYPSAELIALRLLLLGKLERGETLRLSAIVRNEAEVIVQGAELPGRQLAEMGLSAKEAALLQTVFRSEPAFRWYYKSPPLVAAMDAMGLLAPEDLVMRRVRDSHYAAWRKSPKAAGDSRIRVAVLPSLVPGFRSNVGKSQPPEDYLKAVLSLERSLRLAVDEKLKTIDRPVPGSDDLLDIQIHLERPFVIHPLNAAHHVRHLCPDADLVILVLGRNVYRSMALSPPEVKSLLPPQWYLDLIDVKYHQVAAEIDEIATAVIDRLPVLDAAQSVGRVSQEGTGDSDETSENTL